VGVEYRSLSSLCFLHSPVNTSLLGPNILHVLMVDIYHIMYRNTMRLCEV
jgi:hypothetical protein